MSLFKKHPLPWRVVKHDTDENQYKHYYEVVDSTGESILDARLAKDPWPEVDDFVSLSPDELEEMVERLNK